MYYTSNVLIVSEISPFVTEESKHKKTIFFKNRQHHHYHHHHHHHQQHECYYFFPCRIGFAIKPHICLSLFLNGYYSPFTFGQKLGCPFMPNYNGWLLTDVCEGQW